MKLFTSHRFWLGVVFMLIILALRFTDLFANITIQNFKDTRHCLQGFVDEHYLASAALFIGFYILIVLLALPLPSLFTLMGGFLFGTILGTLYSVIGATVGAFFFFLMIRYSLGISIQQRYKNQLTRFNIQIKKYGASYAIAIRGIAFIPFFMQNIIIGLTKISLLRYTWTTVVGILPASLVYAYAGQRLAQMSSITDVFSWSVLCIFVALALLGFVPILVQRYMTR